jgi:hypothetical protein
LSDPDQDEALQYQTLMSIFSPLSAPSVETVSETCIFDELTPRLEDFKRTLRLPFPSSVYPLPKRIQVSVDDHTFVYKVRESFQTLLKFLQTKWDHHFPHQELWYIGPAGMGKSYNLAALAFYLKQKNDKRVIYIPSCRLFFGDTNQYLIPNLKRVFKEAFSDRDAAIFSVMKSAEEFQQFMETEEECSVIFILDDFNGVIGEHGHSDYDLKFNNRKILNALCCAQFSIKAISGLSPTLYGTSSTLPEASDTLHLDEGLTDKEWEIWQANSPEYSKLTPEDKMKVTKFTGRIPLYLHQIANILKQNPLKPIESIFWLFEMFDAYEGRLLYKNLSDSSAIFFTKKKTDFLLMMTAALNSSTVLIQYDIYDHRYFSVVTKKTEKGRSQVLHPSSGLVCTFMMRILDRFYKAEFIRTIANSAWVEIGLNSKTGSIRGFCFESFCICKMIQDSVLPQFAKKVISGSPVQFEYSQFLGDNPEKLNSTGACLYFPSFSMYPYVDAVLRVVLGDGSVYLFGIQITLQTAAEHKHSIDFFLEGGLYCHFLAQRELEAKKKPKLYLVWMFKKELTASRAKTVVGDSNMTVEHKKFEQLFEFIDTDR